MPPESGCCFNSSDVSPLRDVVTKAVRRSSSPKTIIVGRFAGRGISANISPSGERRTTRPPSNSAVQRSEEHTSELQSLMRTSYAVFCLKKKHKYTHKKTKLQKSN